MVRVTQASTSSQSRAAPRISEAQDPEWVGDLGSPEQTERALEAFRMWWRKCNSETGSLDCSNQLSHKTRAELRKAIYMFITATTRTRCIYNLNHLEGSTFWQLSPLDSFAIFGFTGINNRDFLHDLRKLEEPWTTRQDVIALLWEKSHDRRSGRLRYGATRHIRLSKTKEWTPYDVRLVLEHVKSKEPEAEAGAGVRAEETAAESGQEPPLEDLRLEEEEPDNGSATAAGEQADDAVEADVTGGVQGPSRIYDDSQAQTEEEGQEKDRPTHPDSSRETEEEDQNAFNESSSPEIERGRGRGRGIEECDDSEFGFQDDMGPHARDSSSPPPDDSACFDDASFLLSLRQSNLSSLLRRPHSSSSRQSSPSSLLRRPHSSSPRQSHSSTSLRRPHSSSPPRRPRCSSPRRTPAPSETPESMSKRVRPSTTPMARKRARKSLITTPHSRPSARATASTCMAAWVELLTKACPGVCVVSGSLDHHIDAIADYGSGQSPNSYCALIDPGEEEPDDDQRLRAGQVSSNKWQLVYLDFDRKVVMEYCLKPNDNDDGVGARVVKRLPRSIRELFQTPILKLFAPYLNVDGNDEDDRIVDPSHILVAGVATHLCARENCPAALTLEFWEWITSFLASPGATPDTCRSFDILTADECETNALAEAEADFTASSQSAVLASVEKALYNVSKTAQHYSEAAKQVENLKAEAGLVFKLSRRIVNEAREAPTEEALAEARARADRMATELQEREQGLASLAGYLPEDVRGDVERSIDKLRQELTNARAMATPHRPKDITASNLKNMASSTVAELDCRLGEYAAAKRELYMQCRTYIALFEVENEMRPS